MVRVEKMTQPAQREKLTTLFQWAKDQGVQHEREIRKLLRSGDRRLRVAAAAALWRTEQESEGLPALIQAFCSKERDLQLAALYAMSLMREHAQRALLRILREGKRKTYHPQVIRFLGEQPTEATLASLKRYVNADDQEVAKSAIRAFALSDDSGTEKEWGERAVTIQSEHVVPTLTVIVHGTWADEATWWRWPTEFPQYINQNPGDVYKGPRPFKWSGDNTHEARTEGGQALVRWMQEHPAEKLTVVAHSHGGNVGFIASQMGLKIQKLILMGTPIRTDYLPDMNNIQTIYNILSLDDFVQILGAELVPRNGGRVLPEARENIEVETNSICNPHSELRTVPLWKRHKLERILKDS